MKHLEVWGQKVDVDALKAADDVTPDLDRIVREGFESITPSDYYRLKTMGVCSQNVVGAHMIRIRIPHGIANRDQLHRVAELAERYGDGTVHLTTRTNLELHRVPTPKLLEVLEALHEVGLTTRASCGHTVRNVLGCQAAGICAHEVFDTRPYVRAAHELVVAKAADHCVRLPRRLNVSFGGCGSCARHAQVNDVGFVATCHPTLGDGFAVWVAGSLGSQGRFSHPLCTFVRAEHALDVIEVVIDLYTEHGLRDQPAKARLKFLVEDWGIERFRDAFRSAFEARTGTQPVLGEATLPEHACAEPAGTGVLPQRQAGRFRVRVRVPLGDLSPDQLRRLADLAVDDADGLVRLTPEQNAELAWIREERIGRVLAELSSAGLGSFGTGDISDVRACPGTQHCVLAVSDSPAAAALISSSFSSDPIDEEIVRRMRVHISGCANSCAQHQASDIGFAGCKVKIDGVVGEGFQVFVGGRLGRRVRMADRIGRVHIGAVDDTVRAIVDAFTTERTDDEELADVVERLGSRAFAASVTERLGSGVFV